MWFYSGINRTVVAQAKKGGSRRHGAKALDLDSCCRTGEEQEQLAALAPSSALRAPSPASGRRAVWTMSAGGRTASRAAASPTGILTQSFSTPKETRPMAAWFTVVAPFLPDIIQMAKPMFTRDKGADQVPQQIKELQDAATQNAGAVQQLAGEMQRTQIGRAHV